ncbi:MAG: class II aldolase/adducin family protein [Bacteroidales bacterium]
MSEILNVDYMHPRDQVALVISRIYDRGMTTTSGGNISMIDEDGDLWITPSGVDKGSLRPADIICVKKDGTIEGLHKPSSEYPFHKAIYDMRPDIKAIIHAHPPALVSFSIVKQIPNTNVIPQAKQICGEVGYAIYDLPGSNQLGDKIGEEFKKGYMAVIMENHGTVLGGTDLLDAFQRFETLELCSATIINSEALGGTHYLTDEQIQAFHRQVRGQLPEFVPNVMSSEEREQRALICNIVKRACRQGFMLSSYGTVSVRLSNGDILITPTGKSRWNLNPADIVKIHNGLKELGKNHSRALLIHQQIYDKHAHIKSIIITQSPYVMAFANSRVHFNVRTIPESWILLQDVSQLAFGDHFVNKTTVADTISVNSPAVLIQNDSFVVTGGALLQTFDRLEVAEFSAKSLVLAAPLGKMQPISDEAVEELRKAFLG